MGYTYTMGSYLAITKDRILSFVTIWMELEITVVSKMGKTNIT